jgi:hypothetical protein
MKNLKFLIAFAILIPAIPQQSMAQKKILLKYNLKKGDKYVTHITADQEITMQAQGQTITMNQTFTSDISTVIKKVDADSILTSNTMDKMTMDQSMFGQELKYDSSDPTTYASGRGKQIGDALNKMIGKVYSITIDHLGNIGSYDLSSLLENGGSVSSTIKSENNYIIYPNHKIKVGDSWETDIKPLKTDKMLLHLKYTLKKISGKKATIAIDGTITANKLAGQNINMNGTETGEAVVDIKTGWPMSGQFLQNIKMKVEKNGMEIPMEINNTIKISSEKK